MKKLFFLSLVLAVSLSSFADRGTTKLTINSNNKKNLTIMVDGYTKTNGFDNVTSLGDLNSGSHNIKIYEATRTGFFGRRSNKTLYDGNMYLRANFETIVSVSGNGKIDISEHPFFNGRDNKGYDNRNDGRRNDDKRDDKWENNGRKYNQPMSIQSFEQFKQSIRREAFDNTKQNIAMQVLSSSYLSAEQVKQVVQLFSFDQSKLAIAKYAYSNCTDKENYYCVNDAFSFSSSKDELSRYIRTGR
ncbi:MAG: DUF4476 domain-containing protein [Ferruginibacter sp.]